MLTRHRDTYTGIQKIKLIQHINKLPSTLPHRASQMASMIFSAISESNVIGLSLLWMTLVSFLPFE